MGGAATPVSDKFRTTNRESLKKSRSPLRERRVLHYGETPRTERRQGGPRSATQRIPVTPIGANPQQSPISARTASVSATLRSASASVSTAVTVRSPMRDTPAWNGGDEALSSSSPRLPHSGLPAAVGVPQLDGGSGGSGGVAAPVVPPCDNRVQLLTDLHAESAVRCAAGSIDAGVVWTGERSGRLVLRRAATGEAVPPPREPKAGRRGAPAATPQDPHASTLKLPSGVMPNAMVHTPTGMAGGPPEVWVGFTDGIIRVFAYDTGLLLDEMSHHRGAIMAMVADGDAIYTGGQDWKVNHWSIERRAFVTIFKGHELAVRCLTITPACLASGSDDCTIKLWTGAHVAFTSHAAPVLALTCVVDMLWSASDDGVICVHSLQTNALMKKLAVHTAPVVQLLRLDGHGVWSVDKHGVVNVWDGHTAALKQRMAPGGEQQVDWQRHGINAVCVARRCVSYRVWTCSGDGTVRVWASPTEAESDERAAIMAELEALQQERHRSAAHYDALLASRDATILEDANKALEKTVAELRDEQAASVQREAALQAQLDTLRHELSRFQNVDRVAQEDRQQRLRAEEATSRMEARLLVLQEECQARAVALAASEAEGKQLRLRVDGHAAANQELALLREKLLQAEDGQEALLTKNAELCSVLESMTNELSVSHTARQAEEGMAVHVGAVLRDIHGSCVARLVDLEGVVRAAVAECEADAFTSLLDAHAAGLVSIQRVLDHVAAGQSTADGAALASSLARDNEVLTLRLRSLEERITQLTQESIAHSCDESAMQARCAQLQTLLDSHKDELTRTAADLAIEKCECERLRVAHSDCDRVLAELRAVADAALPVQQEAQRMAAIMAQKERAVVVLTETIELKERALAEERKQVEALRFELQEVRMERETLQRQPPPPPPAPVEVSITDPLLSQRLDDATREFAAREAAFAEDVASLKRELEFATTLAAGREQEIDALRLQLAAQEEANRAAVASTPISTTDTMVNTDAASPPAPATAPVPVVVAASPPLEAAALDDLRARLTAAHEALAQKHAALITQQTLLGDGRAREAALQAELDSQRALQVSEAGVKAAYARDVEVLQVAVTAAEKDKLAFAETINSLRAEVDKVRQTADITDVLAKVGLLEGENKRLTTTIAGLEAVQVLVPQIEAENRTLRAELSEASAAIAALSEEKLRLQDLAEAAPVFERELQAKTEQLSQETATMGEMVVELTRRRQEANDLAKRVEDIEAQRAAAAGAVAAVEERLRTERDSWAAERVALEAAAGGAEGVAVHEAMALRLDTVLRENALLREDSQHTIRTLQEQLRVKTDEVNTILYASGPHAVVNGDYVPPPAPVPPPAVAAPPVPAPLPLSPPVAPPMVPAPTLAATPTPPAVVPPRPRMPSLPPPRTVTPVSPTPYILHSDDDRDRHHMERVLQSPPTIESPPPRILG